MESPTQHGDTTDCRSAIFLNKQDAQAYFALGLASAALGKLEAAKNALDRAVRESPLSGQFHLARARAHLALGKHSLAAIDLANAIRLDAGLVDPSWRRQTLAGRDDFFPEISNVVLQALIWGQKKS